MCGVGQPEIAAIFLEIISLVEAMLEPLADKRQIKQIKNGSVRAWVKKGLLGGDLTVKYETLVQTCW
jgi:hypothetical protein